MTERTLARVDELLSRFVEASSSEEIYQTAFQVHHSWKDEYYWPVITALNAPEESKRWEAAHMLGSHRGSLTTRYLIPVLRNREESERVRGQAAESLGYLRKRKAIPALVEASQDESSEVRFWSVFALGNYVRGVTTPTPVVQALEERLEDTGIPNQRGLVWPIGWEALAMLVDCRTSRLPVRTMFRDFMMETLLDPQAYKDRWDWASCYFHHLGPGTREACEISKSKGFDPETFGTILPS